MGSGLHLKLLWLTVSAVLLFLFVQVASANTVSFEEQYQDYSGQTHKYNSNNILLFPMYQIIDNGNSWTISRQGTTVNLPKQFSRNGITFNVSYRFLPDKIIPSIQIDSYSQINNFVVKANASVWYFPFPWSASQVRSVTDDLIDMGVFKRTTSINVYDNNETPNSYQVVPNVIGGDIRLYFNPQTYFGVVYPLTLSENTITVSNATTSGFTSANVTFDSVRWTDSGQIAINLRNDSQANMTGLVAYWSFDETSDTIAHQVNTESGAVNTTNQGTLIGMNTGLDNCSGNCSGWNSSGKIGNALAFDGINDYVDAGSNTSLNFTGNKPFTIEGWIKFNNISNDTSIFGAGTGLGSNGNYGYFVSQYAGNNRIYFDTYNTTTRDGMTSTKANFVNNTYYHLVVTWNGSGNKRIYINSVLDSEKNSTVTSIGIQYNFRVGKSESIYHGNISADEVRVYNRALPASEIAVLYNTSMRTQGNLTILNQSASAGNVINRTRIVYTGQDSINNVSLDATQNGTSNWFTVQENMTNNSWYSLSNQFNNMDFRIRLNGNGSNTPFFTSLEWDETLGSIISFNNSTAVVSNGIITVNVTTWNTSGDYRKNFTINATNISAELNMTICNMENSTWQNIKANYYLVNLSLSNTTGCINYLYTGGSISNLIFIVEPAETNPYATTVAIGGAATIAALYLYRTRRTQIAQYLSRLRGRTMLK